MINYLDNCATTVVYDEVIDEISKTLKEYYANPASLHKLGQASDKMLDGARKVVADELNATKEEIIFTSGASEGNNLILKNFKGHIVTTAIEHPSVINTLKQMESKGVKVTYLDVDENGKIDLEELKNSITKETTLVSIMMVNNEIGTINPIKEIGKIIKELGLRAKFHVDATQGFMKFKIDVKEWGIDFLTASAHKFHGPKGVGFTYIRKGLRPESLITGGSQELGIRAGTHNVAFIRGMEKAISMIKNNMEDNIKKVKELKDEMIEGLKEFKNLKINSPSDSSPYVLNISLVGLRSEIILRLLEDKNVFVSTGSACSQKNMKDSHVLLALGLSSERIKSSIRICFSDTTKKEEITNAIEAFKYAVSFAERIK